MNPRTLLAICCVPLLSGCSYLRFHRIQKAERGTREQAENLKFPDSTEHGVQLDGPAVAALQVALNELLPPDRKAVGSTDELTRCLSRRDIFDVTVTKGDDDIYFVSILPNLSRCGIVLETPILDLGSTYAIDKDGRILSEL